MAAPRKARPVWSWADVRVPKPKPAAAAKPEQPGPAKPPEGPLAIDQLTAAACRWPIDPDGAHGWRYCGKPRSDNPTYCYCPEHLARVIGRTPRLSVRRGRATA